MQTDEGDFGGVSFADGRLSTLVGLKAKGGTDSMQNTADKWNSGLGESSNFGDDELDLSDAKLKQKMALKDSYMSGFSQYSSDKMPDSLPSEGNDSPCDLIKDDSFVDCKIRKTTADFDEF